MHFKIKRLTLLNALAKAARAVSIRSPLPVLTGVKFDLQRDRLILTGSDSDITIQTVIYADDDLMIYHEGAVVLNSRYILEIVRKINSDDIEIEIIDGLLTRIKGSQIEFNLNGTDPIEYPRIDLSKTGTHFLINSMILKDIISETKFAASDKETRPILTGINFKARNQQLECIATDSYRLAKKTISIDEDITFNITIPKLSLDEISKIIEKDETIELYVSDRKVLFVFDNNIVQTRLIDGTYPDTSRLIPSQFDYTLAISKNDLINAIDRVSLLLSEQNNIVKLDMSQNEVMLSSYQQEIGSVEENLTSSTYEGDNLSISFSSKYANDAIKSFSGENITILFTGEMKPFIIKDQEKDDLLQLVLPVRTY
ncbi:DNA polymerase III subunit beta [[Clostridium] spiroforme]|nr:DNA polymerase III subunit beta [Thomasclavelia spiroformis]